MTFIATISGGKDSTCMIDLLLKNNYPLDYIVFKDTLHEFDEMYEYIKKVDSYFQSKYNKSITFLAPAKSFEDSVFGRIGDKSEFRQGWIRGIPLPIGYPCTWRREAKNVPFNKWLKKMDIKKYKVYIGFTTDESNRKMKGDEFLYPLIDDFHFSEKDCQKYLLEHEMENPLYRHFTRTGCSFCPAQSDRSFYQVWKHYPKKWAYMKKIKKQLQDLEDKGEKVQNKYWFTGRRTCEQMEKEFKKLDRQKGLFDLSDEPLKDCFCSK